MSKFKDLRKNVNSSLLFLTFSDIFSWGGYFAINALVALYLAEKLKVNAAEIVGIGNAIYMISRSVVQLPIGLIVDRTKEDRDEKLLLILGCVMMGIPYVLFPSISQTWQYYILQIILGVGCGLNLVNWRKLFAKNLDKSKEGFQYAIYEMLMSVGTALLSIFAGILAGNSSQSFDFVLVLSGFIIMTGGLFVSFMVLQKKRDVA